MKTYRNEQHGFELDMPEEWLPVPAAAYERLGHLMRLFEPTRNTGTDEVGRDCFQFGCFNEAVNFVIGPLFPKRLLDYTELEFKVYAKEAGFTNLEFGRIVIGGEEHVWARYRIPSIWGDRWNKKYMIVFGEMQYSITATCNDPQWFVQREKDWDAIMSSFRLVKSQEQLTRKQIIQEKKLTASQYLKTHKDSKEKRFNLTHPQYYEQESKRVPGDRCDLKLINSSVEVSNNSAYIDLVYKWDVKTKLSFENAFRLERRTRAYIACAIYDAATAAGLSCQALKTFHNQKPSWLINNERIPITLTNAEYKFLDQTCHMKIGHPRRKIGTSPGDNIPWTKLLEGFRNEFNDINV